MSQTNERANYRPEIDGLRALAVIAVIVNHFDQSLLPSGYLGVDIFFVISGYVITMSIVPINTASLGDFLLNFYARRIKRLAPALILFVVVMSVATILFHPAPRASLGTGMASLFGISNIFLMIQKADYFAESTELNSFLHTWSLGVEEQFYLIYPLCVWLCLRRNDNGARKLLTLIFGLSVASLVAFALLYPINQPLAYFMMPTRFWELGAGALVFFLRNSAAFNRIVEKVPAIATSILIIAVLFAPLSATVPATIAVVLLTSLLIAGLRPNTYAHAIFSRREIVYVGLISYPLYLWHWGILWLGRSTIGTDGWAALIEVALMLCLAAASYHLVERPLRRAEWSRSKPVAIAYGLAACGVAVGLIALVIQPLSQRLYIARLLNVPAPTYVQKTWWKNYVTGEFLEKCHVLAYGAKDIAECLAGQDNARRHIHLLGDSHARNYLQALRGVFPDDEVRYLTITYPCAFLPPTIAPKYTAGRCAEYIDEAYRYLTENIRRGDVVFIGQYLMSDARRQTQPYFDFITKFARDIAAKGGLVVLLDGTSPPEMPPEYCADVPWRFGAGKGCSAPRAVVASAYKEFDRLALDATRAIPNLYFAPLRTGLCVGDQCGQLTKSGKPIWHDRGHITDEASSELAPLLRAELEKQGFFKKFAVQR